MVTLTAKENIDPERIWEIRELPRWARVQVHFRREEKWKEPVEWDCVAVFQYMDWMYWLWYSEEDWEPLIFNWKFKQIDQDCFHLLSNEELKWVETEW